MTLDWTLRNRFQSWEKAVKNLTWFITSPGRRPQLPSPLEAPAVFQEIWSPFTRKQTHENFMSAVEVRQAGRVLGRLTPDD